MPKAIQSCMFPNEADFSFLAKTALHVPLPDIYLPGISELFFVIVNLERSVDVFHFETHFFSGIMFFGIGCFQ